MVMLRGTVIRRWKRLAGAVLLVIALCATSAPAFGEEGLVTRARGRCSGPSRWALTIRRTAGDTLGVRLVVTGGRAGQKWNVFMDHNREGFFAGSRTSGPDGFFVVRRRVANLAGDDIISFGANNVPSHETCEGRASL
jgi:hypothetical protein